jgi:cyclic pyranopterin phosphate synthase
VTALNDPFGRKIDYLRISVTDRCNLRCVYCMPADHIRWIPREDLLTREEIVHVVKAGAQLGLRKIRLTGGEPLIRPDIVELIHEIASLDGIEEVSLTTNGMLLASLAPRLAEAGLKRVNVSLDTLQPEKFKKITRYGNFSRVLAGIRAAEGAGLLPVKINAVIVKGINDDELLDFAGLTLQHAWHVRFIELMPIGNEGSWGAGFPDHGQRYFCVQEMQARLSALDIAPIQPPQGNGPARTYAIPGASGTIGFISPMGDHFCQSCNRLRLTADGYLRPCLFSRDEISVREAIPSGKGMADIIRNAVALKPSGHNLDASSLNSNPDRMMCQIGG